MLQGKQLFSAIDKLSTQRPKKSKRSTHPHLDGRDKSKSTSPHHDGRDKSKSTSSRPGPQQQQGQRQTGKASRPGLSQQGKPVGAPPSKPSQPGKPVGAPSSSSKPNQPGKPVGEHPPSSKPNQTGKHVEVPSSSKPNHPATPVGVSSFPRPHQPGQPSDTTHHRPAQAPQAHGQHPQEGKQSVQIGAGQVHGSNSLDELQAWSSQTEVTSVTSQSGQVRGIASPTMDRGGVMRASSSTDPADFEQLLGDQDQNYSGDLQNVGASPGQDKQFESSDHGKDSFMGKYVTPYKHMYFFLLLLVCFICAWGIFELVSD